MRRKTAAGLLSSVTQGEQIISMVQLTHLASESSTLCSSWSVHVYGLWEDTSINKPKQITREKKVSGPPSSGDRTRKFQKMNEKYTKEKNNKGTKNRNKENNYIIT